MLVMSSNESGTQKGELKPEDISASKWFNTTYIFKAYLLGKDVEDANFVYGAFVADANFAYFFNRSRNPKNTCFFSDLEGLANKLGTHIFENEPYNTIGGSPVMGNALSYTLPESLPDVIPLCSIKEKYEEGVRMYKVRELDHSERDQFDKILAKIFSQEYTSPVGRVTPT